LPVEPEPITVTPAPPPPDTLLAVTGESARIYRQHQENLAGLRGELVEVNRLRERSGTYSRDLAIAKELFDGMTDDRLEGRGSDQELSRAKDRKESLEAQLGRLHERQHGAELSLQRRLTADIRAILWLELGWLDFQLEVETRAIAQLAVENRREELRSMCAQIAQVSVSYQQKVDSLGERALESLAWSQAAGFAALPEDRVLD
jgi:hypothetical protein